MTYRPLAIAAFSTLLLIAPLSAAIAQSSDAATTPAAESAALETLPGNLASPAHPRCRHHTAGGKGDHAGKSCHHGKRKQVLEQLERIEQRQILIETMLRQLLERNGS